MLTEVSGDTLSGDSSDTRADVLDDDHEGVGEQHRPGKLIARLRTGLRVGRDTAGIIVRGAGDQTRAQTGPERRFPPCPLTSTTTVGTGDEDCG